MIVQVLLLFENLRPTAPHYRPAVPIRVLYPRVEVKRLLIIEDLPAKRALKTNRALPPTISMPRFFIGLQF